MFVEKKKEKVNDEASIRFFFLSTFLWRSEVVELYSTFVMIFSLVFQLLQDRE